MLPVTPHRCSAYEMQGHFHTILVRFYIHHILISEPSQQWSCLHTAYLSLFSEPSNNWYINVVSSNSYFCLSYDWMLLICWCAIFPYFYNGSCYEKYPILASNCKTLLCFPCIFFIVQWNFLVDELTVCALHSEFLWSLFRTSIYYFQTELN